MSRQSINQTSINYMGIISLIYLSLSGFSFAEPAIMQPVDDIHFQELPPPWLTDTGVKDIRSVQNTALEQSFRTLPITRLQLQQQVKKVLPSKVTTKETATAKPSSIQSLLVAANQGDVQAQYNLGMRYQYGNGVQKSHSKAHRWLDKSAQTGSAQAQYALSLFYQQFAQNQQGTKKALLWLKKAADQDLADAQYSLGMMFKNGTFVYPNAVEARKWLQMASKQGHVAAQLAIDIFPK